MAGLLQEWVAQSEAPASHPISSPEIMVDRCLARRDVENETQCFADLGE